MKYTMMAGLLIAVAATPVFAEDKHREMDAHIHGLSLLKIAIEGDNIAMDLTAPGMDITGFEYEPESEEDHEAVEAAVLR